MCENVRGKNDNELLVTRPDQFKKAINVIHVYGQQECRIGKEGTERHWNEILDVINKVEARNEKVKRISMSSKFRLVGLEDAGGS